MSNDSEMANDSEEVENVNKTPRLRAVFEETTVTLTSADGMKHGPFDVTELPAHVQQHLAVRQLANVLQHAENFHARFENLKSGLLRTSQARGRRMSEMEKIIVLVILKAARKASNDLTEEQALTRYRALPRKEKAAVRVLPEVQRERAKQTGRALENALSALIS
ncbi:MAG: hypothetical protein ACYDBH_00875 [Acidobacteriaceae bacterium]